MPNDESGGRVTRERLLLIAEQVLGGKKLHEIDFGEPRLPVEEKLARIEQAIRMYPMPEAAGAGMQESGSRGAN